MVLAPDKPKPEDLDTEPQINIELSDLEELARINPMAWEQLLHIADNVPQHQYVLLIQG